MPEPRKPAGLLAGFSRLAHSKSRKQLAPQPSKWETMYVSTRCLRLWPTFAIIRIVMCFVKFLAEHD